MQKIKILLETWKQKLFPASKKAGNSLSLSLKDKINFLDQFGSLLHSWIPVTNALKIIMYQTRQEKKRQFIEHIIEQINAGASLKEAAEMYKNTFSKFDVAIIEMGEVSGKLGDAIETIKNKEEKNKEIKGKIVGALIYPMVIVTLATMMVLVFMIYVIPKIQKMYKDAKVNLPGLTDFVIQTSNFLQENIVWIVIWMMATIAGIIMFKKHPKTKIYFDICILHVPLFGSLVKKKILSLFTSSLGTLLSNGIIINESLKISSGAVENDYYEREINKLIDGISKGVELSELMGVSEIQSGKENFLFPIELSSIVKIWESTGTLSELLLKISKKYNREIDDIVKNLSTAIEPLVIVGVGLIVGTIIMAIMLPFFNMVNVM